MRKSRLGEARSLAHSHQDEVRSRSRVCLSPEWALPTTAPPHVVARVSTSPPPPSHLGPSTTHLLPRPPTHLSVYPPSPHPSIPPPTHPSSIHHPFIYLSAHLPIHPPSHPSSIHPSVHHSPTHPSTSYLPTYLSIYTHMPLCPATQAANHCIHCPNPIGTQLAAPVQRATSPWSPVCMLG